MNRSENRSEGIIVGKMVAGPTGVVGLLQQGLQQLEGCQVQAIAFCGFGTLNGGILTPYNGGAPKQEPIFLVVLTGYERVPAGALGIGETPA